MRIQDNMLLRDIQIGFRELFPNLKIEFYTGEHEEGGASPKREQLNATQSLAVVRTVHTEGDLELDPEMSVAALEGVFLERYGLNAQVFRRSGNLWMQTTATDSWSLAEQNRKGGSSRRHFAEKYGE